MFGCNLLLHAHVRDAITQASNNNITWVAGQVVGNNPPLTPYLVRCSRLHVEGSEQMLPPAEVPPEVRLCGKLEVLDRILPMLHATHHKVYCWLQPLVPANDSSPPAQSSHMSVISC